MDAVRDYPINEPGKLKACGARMEVFDGIQTKAHEAVVTHVYICDLPLGHEGMHAQGIILWTTPERTWGPQ